MYRSLLALLSSYGILLIANGSFGTLVSLRTKTEAFPDTVIGVVLSGYFAGLLLSSFYAVRVVAYIGHIRAFATFASIASTVALAHLLWIDPVFWGVLRVVSGFCMGGMIVVTEGWLNERATNTNRGSILSLYTITTYACIGSAQLLMMLSHPEGFKLFVIISILYSFALIPILMTQSQAPAPSLSNRPDIRQLFRVSPVGMMGSFTVGVINGIFYALTPIYTNSLGLDIRQTAIFMALAATSGILLQFPLGKLSDKVDRRWIIIFSSTMTVIACLILFSGTAENMVKLYTSAVFYGAVAFSINPICAAHVNDLSPPKERTQTASGLLMSYGVGAVIGPFGAGFIMPFGVNYIFMISATIAGVFIIYALLRLYIKPRHQQVKGDFKPFSLQSPARRLGFRSENEHD